jgi:minor histocompatibility antigen H13
VYDIFWVFGTDVMVTVATSFEAPIKLKVPKVRMRCGFSVFQFLLGVFRRFLGV